MMKETWTVSLGRSIIGTVLLSVRKYGEPRRTPRSRDELPWRLAEYLEASDKGGRIVLRSSFDEIAATTHNKSVTKRKATLFVTFDLHRYPSIERTQ